MSTAGSKLVLLKTCGDSAEAATVKGLLEANGIACVVQGEQHRAMLGMMGSYIELNLLVAEEELEKAQALLEEPVEGGPGAEPSQHGTPGTPDTEEAVCPVHGERATTSCTRCGTFLCARCELQGGSICEDCVERKGTVHQVQRSSRRRLVAWVVLGLLFGPMLFLMLARIVASLLG